MVFDKNVDRAKIEQFENLILEKVSNSEFVILLKNELKKKHLKFAIHIQHTEPDFKKYCSHLVIDIYNEYGDRVFENDEPNCCLMLCEPICFKRYGHIVGIDLYSDNEFCEMLNLLITQVKEYNL